MTTLLFDNSVAICCIISACNAEARRASGITRCSAIHVTSSLGSDVSPRWGPATCTSQLHEASRGMLRSVSPKNPSASAGFELDYLEAQSLAQVRSDSILIEFGVLGNAEVAIIPRSRF